MAPRLFVITLLGIGLTGCVSAGKYEALKLEKDQAVEELAAANTAKARAEGELATLKANYEALMGQGGDLAKLVAQYQKESESLRQSNQQLAADLDKIRGSADVFRSTPLDPVTSSKLAELEKEFPGLFKYDRERGVLQFLADVTFASGSAELTPQAKTAIAKLATVLNSPSASVYELVLAGHTDNQRVVHETTLRLHKDNWYLSAHRAISVAEALMSQGVTSQRVGALGYADQRPIASNGTNEGRARNRRVELILLPSTYRSAHYAETTTTPPAKRTTPVRAKGADFNKDTVRTDSAPVFTK